LVRRKKRIPVTAAAQLGNLRGLVIVFLITPIACEGSISSSVYSMLNLNTHTMFS